MRIHQLRRQVSGKSRFCWLACLPLVLSASAFVAQSQQVEELPPSLFEAYAARASARVVWAKPIGGIESDAARATVTALSYADAGAQPRVMRGVRVDLAHVGATPKCDQKYPAWRILCKRANAALYIEEAKLAQVRDALDRHNVAELRPREFITLYSSTVNSGMILGGYQFAYHEPRELAKLLTSAINELNNASR